MTHVNILMVGYIVSETQTDRQANRIITTEMYPPMNILENHHIYAVIWRTSTAVELIKTPKFPSAECPDR